MLFQEHPAFWNKNQDGPPPGIGGETRSHCPGIGRSTAWPESPGDLRVTDSHAHQLVAKLWNYCHILRDDGLSYGDYVEQLT